MITLTYFKRETTIPQSEDSTDIRDYNPRNVSPCLPLACRCHRMQFQGAHVLKCSENFDTRYGHTQCRG